MIIIVVIIIGIAAMHGSSDVGLVAESGRQSRKDQRNEQDERELHEAAAAALLLMGPVACFVSGLGAFQRNLGLAPARCDHDDEGYTPRPRQPFS
jgi:hypothetical protein